MSNKKKLFSRINSTCWLAHLKAKYEIHSFCEYNPLPFIIKIPAHNHPVLWLSAQQHNKIAICQLLFFVPSYRRNDYNTLVYFLKLVEKLLWIPHSSLNIFFFYSNILNNWFPSCEIFYCEFGFDNMVVEINSIYME